ncbi:MAG: cyclase family protein [Ignavibacteriae bacterium]|nr:cyclase family protein [Ignavibacteriota bacterium]
MIATINHNNQTLKVDLSKPIDISIPMKSGADNPNAFFLPNPSFEPFRIYDFVGSTREGGACNCETLTISPHGNGTHTESVGHISKEVITINQSLTTFFFLSEVVSVQPTDIENGDQIVTSGSLKAAIKSSTEALIIRTLPNIPEKKHFIYSGDNPAYLDADAATWLRERGVLHLLIDLPSIDREEDGGKLEAHHNFWNYPSEPRTNATITELIFVPDEIPDGLYLLNLQICSLETDAAPSKPVLYSLL